MSNVIIRPIDTEGKLGFDEHGQLWAQWTRADSSYATIVPDLRHKVCAICKRGWPFNVDSFRDYYQYDDVFGYIHKTCWVGHLTLEEVCMWRDLMIDLKFVPFIMRTIPNEYGGAWNTPWYEASFTGFVPKLKLGRRKNVWHMSMHDLTDSEILHAAELFKGIESTNWATTAQHEAGAHAWSKDEAKQHLEAFRKVLHLHKNAKAAEETTGVK